MTRHYSQLSPLEQLGWQPFFSEQTSVEDLGDLSPVRVVQVHRSGLHVLGDGIDDTIPPGPDATVGDWMLYDHVLPSASKVLERRSLFERIAPGADRKRQLIAANVDTVFIVTSCNNEFNIARLERYVILAVETEARPVILLTKADLCDDPAPYVDAARSISDGIQVELLNALSDEPIAKLSPWCTQGQTVAFLGSSGVGKSTLVNALFEEAVAETGDIREDDSKGRHTTTRRQLHFTAHGCAVVDTPGMRELQLADVEAGIAGVFADIFAIASQCRFKDCSHEPEPGCAVRKALELGEIDPVRFERWNKLAAEDRSNSTALVERKAEDKVLYRSSKKHQQNKNRKTINQKIGR
jgi:ribosome biogenesis GTPase